VSEENNVPIVIDCGSGTCKTGFAGNDLPKSKIPTVIGRSEKTEIDKSHIYVGKNALLNKKGILQLSYPIQKGCITNFDDMERVWKSCFKKLKKEPQNSSVILTEIPGNPKDIREEITKIFFEKFKISNFYIGVQSAFGLYSTGRTTGVVLDLGEQISYAVPIYNGYALSHQVENLAISGSALTNYLKNLLEKNNLKLEYKVVNKIKEKLCYIAEDFDEEIKKDSKEISKTYKLPDGNEIEIGFDRILCPEILFQPKMGGKFEHEGIHIITRQLVKKCISEKIKSSMLYENIVLIGGTSEFNNIGIRMQREMNKIIPKGKKKSNYYCYRK